jgi:hypothetical protein
MGYYRNGKNDKPEPEPEKEIVAKYYSSFEELPEDVYKELVERSLNIAERIKDRSNKLHELLSQEVGLFDGTTLEEAYWRTACVEQIAFMEMQITNLHSYLINKQ